MCESCNGSYVIHEKNSLGYRFSGCKECTPEPVEVINARMDGHIAWADEMIMKKENVHEPTNYQNEF